MAQETNVQNEPGATNSFSEAVEEEEMAIAGTETFASAEDKTPLHSADARFDEAAAGSRLTDTAYFQHALVEAARRLFKSTMQQQHYTKGCLWSPDGTCLLLPVHLDGMHIIDLPRDLYELKKMPAQRTVSSLPSAVHVPEGGTVYDYIWYPFMNSNVANTCCWLSTRQHEPIHMWDAFNGELRCSYRGFDSNDDMETAISIAFSNDAEKIIAGYKRSIKIFDTVIPGRDFVNLRVKQAISCIALSPDSNDSITTGSWNGYVQHYDLRAPELGALFTLGGHKAGITWLRYGSSQANWFLYTGARMDNQLLQWDMRNYAKPLRIFERTVQTNQRISFDLSAQQKWLVSGDTRGVLHAWNLAAAHDEEEHLELPLHVDCCNGAQFHPMLPLLATTAGQYHMAAAKTDDDDNKQPQQIEYENSLLLWWLGQSAEVTEDDF